MDLTPSTPPSDKREALKWHNRRAIVVAAAVLAREHGLHGFTVNDLATAAGVSRRTIFNHFSGVEDAVQASFVDAISSLYNDFEAQIADERFADLAEAFERFAQAAQQLDVVGTVTQALLPLLPDPHGVSGRQGDHAVPLPSRGSKDLEILAVRVTDSASRSIVGLLGERVEHADPFQAHLMGEQLITAMTVCADRWFAQTQGELTEDTRRLWHAMWEQAIRCLRDGFVHDAAAEPSALHEHTNMKGL